MGDKVKIKKIPIRTCVVTGEKIPKKELLRIVKTPDLEIVVDITGKINGRGAYIKKDLDVLEKARKNKVLERKLEVSISDEIYDKIGKTIKEN